MYLFYMNEKYKYICLEKFSRRCLPKLIPQIPDISINNPTKPIGPLIVRPKTLNPKTKINVDCVKTNTSCGAK